MNRLIVSVNVFAIAASLSMASADSPYEHSEWITGDGSRVAMAAPDEQDELRLMLMDEDPSIEQGTPATEDPNERSDSDRSDPLSIATDLDFDSAEEQQAANAEKQQADDRLAQRMSVLRKSPRDLRVGGASVGKDDVPVNQAAAILDEPPRWIFGGDRIPEPADRVHTRFCHQPTYYQEMNLERCGRVDCERLGCLQNLYSSFWFVTNTAILPYRVASQPHCRCVQAYGDCTTCQRYECSIEPLGCGDDCCQTGGRLLSESAAIAGFAFLLL